MIGLFKALGRLPLPLNHFIGAAIGLLAGWFASRHRRTTLDNLAQYARATGADASSLTNAAFREQGKGLTELAIAWTSPLETLMKLVPTCVGWEHVEAAQAANRPIIFVTPHLGCYDLAGRYIASRTPITAMYRPPKQAKLEPLMQEGRARGGATTVPADGSGVRGLLKTLKQGGSIMILPDQVPGQGDGVWAPFFGKPAYTMTLLPRLAESAHAVVLFFFAERLSGGRGYRVIIEPMTEPYSTDREIAARQTNAMVEKLIAMAPSQYLWGYNRYKQPAGAPPAPASAETPNAT